MLPNSCRRCGSSNNCRSRSCPVFHLFLSPFQLPAYNVLMIAQPQTSWLFIQREMIFWICIHYLRQKRPCSPCLLCQQRASSNTRMIEKESWVWLCFANAVELLCSFFRMFVGLIFFRLITWLSWSHLKHHIREFSRLELVNDWHSMGLWFLSRKTRGAVGNTLCRPQCSLRQQKMQFLQPHSSWRHYWQVFSCFPKLIPEWIRLEGTTGGL